MLDDIVQHAARFLDASVETAQIVDVTRRQQLVKSIHQAHKEHLYKLEDEARRTRKPIPFRNVEDLLFDTEEHEYGEGRLDPEHFSRVGFTYESETAQFAFTLPFRNAASFLMEDFIRKLPSRKITPGGKVGDREITTSEALTTNLPNLIAKLENYHMDSLVLAIFELELLRQCRFAILALEDAGMFLRSTEDYRLTDQTRFWFSVQTLLSAVANISKILWPSKSAGSIGQERGNKLRKILKVDNDSPLKARNCETILNIGTNG
jgi:hypothetical protein